MSWHRIVEDPLCAIAEHVSDKKEKNQSKHQSSVPDAERAAAQPDLSTGGEKSAAKSTQAEANDAKSTSAATSEAEPTIERKGEAVHTPNAERLVITGRRLFAISDIHLSYRSNVDFWSKLTPHPDDGLILAGDVGETDEHLELAFSIATRCFRQVWWTVGNHELYSIPKDAATGDPLRDVPRGEKKYERCVEIARRYGVLTPEDEFVVWKDETTSAIVAPIFTLYDYSFAPDDVPVEKALAWAEEEDIVATDEALLHSDPYPSKQAWCASLISKFEKKLDLTVQQNPGIPLVLINHWPLRRDTVKFFRVPRFIIWCGTKKTDDWHARFNAKVVVTGHIHIRRTDWRKSNSSWTRFEEVSMGYPREWKDAADTGNEINSLLREILPGPNLPESLPCATVFRRYG